MQFTIKHFERNGNEVVMKNEVIKENEITSFGVVNDITTRKDGHFKKFVKRGYVQTGENVYIGVMLSQVKTIKEAFKGRLKINRQAISAKKLTKYGCSEQKAINWEYRVQEGA